MGQYCAIAVGQFDAIANIDLSDRPRSADPDNGKGQRTLEKAPQNMPGDFFNRISLLLKLNKAQILAQSFRQCVAEGYAPIRRFNVFMVTNTLPTCV